MLLTLLLAGSLANAPSVDEILERAIEVQRLHEKAGNEVKYDYELLSVTEKLDKNGDVKEVEEQLFESNHIEDVAYERLVKKDGKPLTQKELKREAKRERNFRKKLAKGEARHNDAEERVAFDEELILRYDFQLDDTCDFSGRKTYVLSYKPKPGPPPEPEPETIVEASSASASAPAALGETPAAEAPPPEPEPEPAAPIRVVGRERTARVDFAPPFDADEAEEPMESGESDVAIPSLVLQGTSVIDGNPVAVISDQRVFEGDLIEGARVVRIGEREVELELEGKRFVLRL